MGLQLRGVLLTLLELTKTNKKYKNKKLFKKYKSKRDDDDRSGEITAQGPVSHG